MVNLVDAQHGKAGVGHGDRGAAIEKTEEIPARAMPVEDDWPAVCGHLAFDGDGQGEANGLFPLDNGLALFVEANAAALQGGPILFDMLSPGPMGPTAVIQT